MNQPFFQADDLANEWASRICARLEKSGVTPEELSETRNIIFSFTRTAVSELEREPEVYLPHSETPFKIEAKDAHMIIELFLRGVHHCARKLRDTTLDWDVRRGHLETLAWKLFNLAKLLVGFLNIPDPNVQSHLHSHKDLQMMMKQSADTMLREELSGVKGVQLPWNMNWKP